MNALVPTLRRGSVSLLRRGSCVGSKYNGNLPKAIAVSSSSISLQNYSYAKVQPTLNQQFYNNNTPTSSLSIYPYALLGAAALYSSSQSRDTASCTPTANLGPGTDVYQLATFDHLLKDNTFYPNSSKTFESFNDATDPRGANLTQAVVTSELNRLQTLFDNATQPYKQLPQQKGIPGHLPSPAERQLSVTRDIDNFRLAWREGRVLVKMIELGKLDKAAVDLNDIKIFPSYSQGNNQVDLALSAARCTVARGSSCPYDIYHLTSSFGGSDRLAHNSMLSGGDAYHFNMPPRNIQYNAAHPRLTTQDIGISTALHGTGAGGTLDPMYNFLDWHKPPHLQSILNLWAPGTNLNIPPLPALRNGYYHCFPHMEPIQRIPTYISRISDVRWNSLCNYAQVQYGWPDGGVGLVNSGLAVNAIIPGNWLGIPFMCAPHHFNRQVNRLAFPNVGYRPPAWVDQSRYDDVRAKHYGPPENYNARRDELLEVMTQASAYLSGGNTPPSRIPGGAEEAESAYAATCFLNGLGSHYNKGDRDTYYHPSRGDDGFQKGATCFFIDHEACRKSQYTALSAIESHGHENIVKFRFPVIPTSAMHIINGPAMSPWTDARVVKFYENKRPMPGGELWWHEILEKPLFGCEDDGEEGDEDKKTPKTKAATSNKQQGKLKGKSSSTNDDSSDENAMEMGKISRKRKRGCIQEESSSTAHRHEMDNDNDAPKKKLGQSKKDKSGEKKLSSLLEEEQLMFTKCEEVFLPIMEKLTKAKDDSDVKRVLKRINAINERVDLLTPPFLREYPLGMLVKQVRKAFEVEHPEVKEQCKSLSAEMRRLYNEKDAKVPEEFEAVKNWKKH